MPTPSNQRAMRDRLLRLGYTARSADDDASALDIVSSTPPDVVLVPGLAEPAKDGPSYRNNWTTGAYLFSDSAHVPAIPSTNLTDIINQISDADLKLRVESALSSRSLLKALVVENARLEAERLHDPLTGLFNRRYVMIRVEEEVGPLAAPCLPSVLHANRHR